MGVLVVYVCYITFHDGYTWYFGLHNSKENIKHHTL